MQNCDCVWSDLDGSVGWGVMIKKWIICLGLLATLSLSACNKATEDQKASEEASSASENAEAQHQDPKGDAEAAKNGAEAKDDAKPSELSAEADSAESAEHADDQAIKDAAGDAERKDPNLTVDGLHVYHVDVLPTEGLARPKAEKHVSFKVLDKKKSKWLDPDTWIIQNSFEKPQIPNISEGYLIEGDPEAEYGYMHSALLITSADKKYVFDFYSHTLQHNNNDVYPYIKYATIYNGIIYAEIAHNNYTKDNPHTGFVIALNFEGKVLWISKEQVCNSNNFVILDNTIVCGYGFTREPDHVYMLDVNTGEHVGDLSLSNKADYFLIRDNIMYILGYNTEYTFEIKRK